MIQKHVSIGKVLTLICFCCKWRCWLRTIWQVMRANTLLDRNRNDSSVTFLPYYHHILTVIPGTWETLTGLSVYRWMGKPYPITSLNLCLSWIDCEGENAWAGRCVCTAKWPSKYETSLYKIYCGLWGWFLSGRKHIKNPFCFVTSSISIYQIHTYMLSINYTK